MSIVRPLIAAAVVCMSCFSAAAQEQQSQQRNYPPQMEDANVEVYKKIDGAELNIYIFRPEEHKPSDRRPAAVFFFGGGWRAGTPKQFEQQCRYLASRGMVAMTADYRVLSRHGTPAKSCVTDAKSAIRWVRRHADRLGVDPDRILAGGGSAGGHVAACTGTIQRFDQSGEDMSISSKPNAMALFNPAVVLAQVGDQLPLRPETLERLRERMGDAPEALSPYHQVRAGAPPTIVFHGKGDTTVPYRTAELFEQAMTKAGNRCQLVGYDEQPHGFFNYGRNENKYFLATIRELDKFLAALGYLEGEPTIDQWLKK